MELRLLPAAEDLARIPPAARLVRLATSLRGLGAAEAEARSLRWGSNAVEPPAVGILSRLSRVTGHFTHSLALLLWFAAGLAVVADAPQLAGAIAAIVVINGVLSFVQERRAASVVESLMEHVALRAAVVRDGKVLSLPARQLVPGDVIQLDAGSIVPADCVLIETESIELDLSMLTGESTPVFRDAQVDAAEGKQLSEYRCIAPSGAIVLAGSATAAVLATGSASSTGKVVSLSATTVKGETALERQIDALSRTTAVVAVATGAATLVAVEVRGDADIVQGITFGTGVLVALVPEGLLPTLAISLAIGARRMARRGCAVRRLSAVESVGATTVICTDKTGTLTTNRLAVSGFIPASEDSALKARALRVASACNDARHDGTAFNGDAVDVALADWAVREGLEPAMFPDRANRAEEVPFEASKRYMRVDYVQEDGRETLVKGAPEAVVGLLRERSSVAFAGRIALAAEGGARLIALADGKPGELSLVGCLALEDPVREDVPEAVARCLRAGIRVIMLTGDHPATALSVARAIGMPPDVEAIEGAALGGMDRERLGALMLRPVIFARIDPTQKLRIVTTLNELGEHVLVTGDGINDAPALRAANVGVAMGLRGSDVAKQAGDVILADDHFATILVAIEEGRSLKSNIRRFVSYVFTSNVAEVVPFVCYVLLPIPLPLAVVQVLAIDLGTDLLPAMALGSEGASKQTLQQTPEAPGKPILTKSLALKTFAFFGVIEAALGMTSFLAYLWAHGWRPFESFGGFAPGTIQEASTLTFLGIVSGQVGCLFANRDGSLSERLSFKSNPFVGWSLAFEVVLVTALVYVPGLNEMFSMSPVPPAWLLVVPVGATFFVAADAVRRRLALLCSRIAKGGKG